MNIRVFSEHIKGKNLKAETKKVIRGVLKDEGKVADITVVFVNDNKIYDINAEFLNHHYVTDVITFPLTDETSLIEAEIYINLDQAERQAIEYGVQFTEEVKRLIIHGVLHLLGYDDKTEKDRKKIRQKEDEFLQKLNT